MVRGGYGIHMGPVTGGAYNGNAIPTSGFQGNTPWVTSLSGVNPLNTLSNPFPQGFIFPTGSSLGLATNLGQAVAAMDRDRRTSSAEQWNLDIQHTLPKKVLADVGYGSSLINDGYTIPQ